MRARTTVAGAAAAAALAATAPCFAATASPRPQVVDPAGDANGINDQGEDVSGASAATPVDYSPADITSVTFANTFAKKGSKLVLTGFTVTLKLAAAPGPQLVYRVTAATPSCANVFFEYDTAADATIGKARCAGVPTSKPIAITAAKVMGSSIVWTVPLASIPAKTRLSALGASVRGLVGGSTTPSATVPQIDAASSTATFTVGK
jgi:hypothetical protein